MKKSGNWRARSPSGRGVRGPVKGPGKKLTLDALWCNLSPSEIHFTIEIFVKVYLENLIIGSFDVCYMILRGNFRSTTHKIPNTKCGAVTSFTVTWWSIHAHVVSGMRSAQSLVHVRIRRENKPIRAIVIPTVIWLQTHLIQRWSLVGIRF